MLRALNKIYNKGVIVNRSAIVLATLLLFSGCDRGPNDPGWDYFPGMAYSPAYQTWSENPVLPEGKTMQNPVPGTIPRNMIPYQYEKTDEDLARAGRELFSPLEPSDEIAAQGKKLYTFYCKNCHGEKGDGLGHLFTSGKFLVPPRSLVSDVVKELPDGSIYHVITVGFGVMAEHGYIVRPDERWKIIQYIRQGFPETDK
jgi:mono/diheme cytochrome c family protein